MKTLNKSIDELLTMIKSDEISVEELVISYLEQIEKTNDKLKAYITIDREGAINKAKEIDKKKQQGAKMGALAGIPMVASDDISTKGIRTTLNSKMLENYIPPFNATVIDKLYEEDSILLGKSNIREFGVGESSNPWGTATAIENNEAAFGLVSDTIGEARQSAVTHNLYGLKPTYGMVSRFGLIGSSPSFEQIGIIAKHIDDLHTVFELVKGKDQKDSTSLDVDVNGFSNSITDSLEGIKIAIPKELFIEGTIIKTINLMERLGANIEFISIPSLEYVLQVYEIISSGEFSSNMGKFDGITFGYRASDYKNIDELYSKSRAESFGEAVKKKIIFGNFVLSSNYYKDYYEKSQRIRAMIKKELKEVFNQYDVILTPVINKESELGRDLFTIPANIGGLPALSMPNIDNDLGVQLMGPAFSENKLFAITSVFAKEMKIGGEI